jgi:hypothetical protein
MESYGSYVATAADVDAGYIIGAQKAENLRACRMAMDWPFN